MTDFRGYVSFQVEHQARGDRDRAGAGFFSAGVGKPRVWSDDVAALGLAQRIVTPEDRRERQPLADQAGRVILFNGYLFDRSGLTAELGLSPSRPDSEVAAAWLDRHGLENLQRLRGDYTFALWDSRARRLHLVVAPLAMRVVYWHAGANAFWFATTLAALHQFPGVPRVLDALQMALQFTAHVGDPADTIYRDTRLLPPGTRLTVDARGAREEAFWRPDPTRRLTLGSPGAYAEAALALMDRAVKDRLRCVTGPGVLLSGGFDSAAIAASAMKANPASTLDSYTVVPPPGQTVEGRAGCYDSERDHVETLAARYPNLRPRFCHSTGPASFETDPTPLFVAGGRTHFIANHLGWFDPAYRAAQRDGHPMLLAGSMGNLTLSYDGQRGLADYAQAGRIDKIAQLLPPLSRFRGESVWKTTKRNILYPSLPPAWRDALWRRRHPGRNPWAGHAALRTEFANDVDLDAQLWAAGEDGAFLHQTNSRKMQAHFLQNRRTRNLEHLVTMRALYGIEQRDPYADPDLVDFCLAIPREQYLLGGQTRSLARRALADRLPATILDERKHGQQNPEWFTRISAQRESWAAEVERLAQVPLAAAMLDLPRLKRLVDTWPADAEAAKARRFDYEHLLPRAVQTGRFIRWSQGGNS